jgi:hypothetical protein
LWGEEVAGLPERRRGPATARPCPTEGGDGEPPPWRRGGGGGGPLTHPDLGLGRGPGRKAEEGRDGGAVGRPPALGEPPEAEERSRHRPVRRLQTEGDRSVWWGGDRRGREKGRGRRERGDGKRWVSPPSARAGGGGASAGAAESPPSCLRETTREPQERSLLSGRVGGQLCGQLMC